MSFAIASTKLSDYIATAIITDANDPYAYWTKRSDLTNQADTRGLYEHLRIRRPTLTEITAGTPDELTFLRPILLKQNSEDRIKHIETTTTKMEKNTNFALKIRHLPQTVDPNRQWTPEEKERERHNSIYINDDEFLEYCVQHGLDHATDAERVASAARLPVPMKCSFTQSIRDAGDEALLRAIITISPFHHQTLAVREYESTIFPETLAADDTIETIKTKLSANRLNAAEMQFASLQRAHDKEVLDKTTINSYLMQFIKSAIPCIELTQAGINYLNKEWHLILGSLDNHFTATSAGHDLNQYRQHITDYKHTPGETIHNYNKALIDKIATYQILSQLSEHVPILNRLEFSQIKNVGLRTTDVEFTRLFPNSTRYFTNAAILETLFSAFTSTGKDAPYYTDVIDFRKQNAVGTANYTTANLIDALEVSERLQPPTKPFVNGVTHSSAINNVDATKLFSGTDDTHCNYHGDGYHSTSNCKLIKKKLLSYLPEHPGILVLTSTGLPFKKRTPLPDTTEEPSNKRQRSSTQLNDNRGSHSNYSSHGRGGGSREGTSRGGGGRGRGSNGRGGGGRGGASHGSRGRGGGDRRRDDDSVPSKAAIASLKIKRCEVCMLKQHEPGNPHKISNADILSHSMQQCRHNPNRTPTTNDLANTVAMLAARLDASQM